jgi:hypothetical protein
MDKKGSIARGIEPFSYICAEIVIQSIMNLSNIKRGLPAISPGFGSGLYDAIVTTMHRAGHPEIVSMLLSGDQTKQIVLEWEDTFSEQIDRTFKKDSSMIDAAAVGVSCLLAKEETDYTVVERAYKGSGFDYY